MHSTCWDDAYGRLQIACERETNEGILKGKKLLCSVTRQLTDGVITLFVTCCDLRVVPEQRLNQFQETWKLENRRMKGRRRIVM